MTQSITKPALHPLSTVKYHTNFDWLRLFLAASVAFFHAGYFSRITNGEDCPFGIIPFPMVPTFLALSGYLILQSYEYSISYFHFIWKRILRIIPALLFSVVVSGIIWGFRTGVIGSIYIYISGGLLTKINGGNGSLWSLFWEEIAYFTMVVLFILKAYKKPWIIWMLFFLSCAVAAANNQQEPTWRITNLFPAFFSGNLVYLYRDLIGKIPWKLAVAVIIIESFINKAFGFQPQAWYMVPLCSFSALILCINAPSLPRLKVDLSYGLYVYHDPIYSWASKVAPYSFSTIFLTGSTVLLGVTLISWYLIEKPALTLKNWFYLK